MLYNHHSDVEKLPTVDLIVAGYEWNCPECHSLMHIIEVLDVVECKKCHNLFKTNPPEHANE